MFWCTFIHSFARKHGAYIFKAHTFPIYRAHRKWNFSFFGHIHSQFSYKILYILKAHTFPIYAPQTNKTFTVFSIFCPHSFNTCTQERNIIFKGIARLFVHIHAIHAYNTGTYYLEGLLDFASTFIQCFQTTQKNKTLSFWWRLFVHIHSSYAYKRGK